MQGIIKFVFSQQMKHSALSSVSASAYVVALVLVLVLVLATVVVGVDMEIFAISLLIGGLLAVFWGVPIISICCSKEKEQKKQQKRYESYGTI